MDLRVFLGWVLMAIFAFVVSIVSFLVAINFKEAPSLFIIFHIIILFTFGIVYKYFKDIYLIKQTAEKFRE